MYNKQFSYSPGSSRLYVLKLVYNNCLNRKTDVFPYIIISMYIVCITILNLIKGGNSDNTL